MGLIKDICDGTLEWVEDRLSVAVVGLFLVLLIACFGFFYEAFLKPPPTSVVLPIDSWHCTQVKPVTTTYYIYVGKVMVPQTMTENVCTQYTMN